MFGPGNQWAYNAPYAYSGYDPQGYPYAVPVALPDYNLITPGSLHLSQPRKTQQEGGVISSYQEGGSVEPTPIPGTGESDVARDIAMYGEPSTVATGGDQSPASARLAHMNAIYEHKLKQMKLQNELNAKHLQLLESHHQFKKEYPQWMQEIVYPPKEIPTYPRQVVYAPVTDNVGPSPPFLHSWKRDNQVGIPVDVFKDSYQTGGVTGDPTYMHQPPDIFGRSAEKGLQQQAPPKPPPPPVPPVGAGQGSTPAMTPQYMPPQFYRNQGMPWRVGMNPFQEGGFVQNPALPPDDISGPILNEDGMQTGKYAMREGEIVIPPELAKYVSIQPGAEKLFKPEIVRALGKKEVAD